MCSWLERLGGLRRGASQGLGAVLLSAFLTTLAGAQGGPRASAQSTAQTTAQTTTQTTTQATAYPGIGRAATPAEIVAWDIDVRPDFKGLPPGSGSVARGMVVWEEQCASCHGIFGESNEVFMPITGGTTAADIQSGRVARLNDASFPGRSTLMKLPTLSSLWDYIRRAMPWNNPKTLSDDDVYAVTAYVLNLGGVMAEGETLSEQNVRQIQQRLPNRNGMTTDHGLWPGRGFGRHSQPDVHAVACMSNCAPAPTVASSLPEHARNAHGNLAEQNRSVGPQRGVDTLQPAPTLAVPSARPATLAPPPTVQAGPGLPGAPVVPSSPAAGQNHAGVAKLLQTHNCMACHGMDRKLVGPSLTAVARRYAGRSDAASYLDGRIRAGGVGVWGPIAMPAQNLPPADAQAIAQWLAGGAPALSSAAQPQNSSRK